LIKYDKLFELLKEKNVSVCELYRRNIIGKSTITMLKKHTAGLSSNDLDQICELLNCQPGDLMEYTSNEKRL